MHVKLPTFVDGLDALILTGDFICIHVNASCNRCHSGKCTGLPESSLLDNTICYQNALSGLLMPIKYTIQPTILIVA